MQNKLKKAIRNKKRELLLIAVTLAISVIFYITNPSFLRYSNITSIFSNYAVYGIMAIGMMLVISTGNIDVSVGAQLAVISMVLGALVKGGWITDVISAVAASIAMGLILGLINGFLVAKIKLPAIIVTLGTLNIMRGTLLLLLGSSWISGLSGWFTAIARTMPFNLGFKVTAYVWLLVYIIAYFIMYHTVMGRRILAVGADPEAAHRIGFKPSTSYIFAFSFMGIMSGLGALFYTANIGMAQPVAGIGYEMTLIAAVVIGGTSFSGGKISILGTFVGVLLLAVIENGMIIAKVPVYWQEFVKGIVIIVAIISSIADHIIKVIPERGKVA